MSASVPFLPTALRGLQYAPARSASKSDCTAEGRNACTRSWPRYVHRVAGRVDVRHADRIVHFRDWYGVPRTPCEWGDVMAGVFPCSGL